MPILEGVRQDLRYAARTLFRHRAFTAIAILALALGIAVNAIVFTAYRALVARPLDARDPDTLVNLVLRLQSGATEARFSYLDFEAYRDNLRSLSGVIAVSTEVLTLSDPSDPAARPQATNTFAVSDNYFSVLGVALARGRAFDAISASELAASPSVLISDNYWRQRFAADPGIVGRTVRLNGVAFTIVGVTPADFTGTSIAVPNFWLPLRHHPLVRPGDRRLEDREDLCCRLFGRLAPGVSMDAAQDEASILAARLRGLHAPGAELSKPVRVLVTPGSPLPGINATLRASIVLLVSAAMMVLVIACANAAGLELARLSARQHELATRWSIGASRWRLIQQLLTESALLGLLAGAAALPATWALMRLAVRKGVELLPPEFTLILDVTPDIMVFAYVTAISLGAGLLFGLLPALSHTRPALLAITRTSAASFGRGRLRGALIAAQVAVSLTLMIAGGLLVRSAIQALTMDTGYEVDRTIEVTLKFADKRHETVDARAALANDLRTRLTATPGVSAVTTGRAPGGRGLRRAAFSLNGQVPSTDDARGATYYTWVQPNYFDTLGISLVRGRGFAAPVEQARVAIVSEAAARRLWPMSDPIGRTLRFATATQLREQGELVPDGPVWTVVGVARDTRGVTMDRSDTEQVYLPLPRERAHEYPMLARTSDDADLVARRIDPLIARLDPALTATATTLRAMLRQSDVFLAASVSAAVASSIGLVGLLLATMGIYSAVSYDVVLRTREVGIRMAIGARRRDVLAVVMGGSTRAVLVGLAIGVVLAIGAARLLRGVLYGMGTADVISFTSVSLLFLAVALAASWVPSRRAIRIDPLAALRDQ
jgi:predicted permease